MKETERIKAGLLFRPNSMELRDTKHKAHETCRLVNTLDEYDERIPGLMRSILGKIGERFYFQTPVLQNHHRLHRQAHHKAQHPADRFQITSGLPVAEKLL